MVALQTSGMLNEDDDADVEVRQLKSDLFLQAKSPLF